MHNDSLVNLTMYHQAGISGCPRGLIAAEISRGTASCTCAQKQRHQQNNNYSHIERRFLIQFLIDRGQSCWAARPSDSVRPAPPAQPLWHHALSRLQMVRYRLVR
ncbi:hypothetical protein THICB2_520002 [Thiomonas sp. CB2]|jgi:hypothetical protein|nr:hypothetical protein THICB2_520002 [Thiomonas sp. CB2]